MKRLTEWAGIDRAVSYGLISKAWEAGSGPVSILLIASYFSPEVQGYYFTFASILALRVFVQLGLGTVIRQFAAHEWAKLKLSTGGEIEGDPEALSRLISLGRLAVGWFVVGGSIAAVVLGVGGYVFFSVSGGSGIDWVGPWFLVCALSALNLYLLPIWALLEGCNQVSRVYAFQLVAGILNAVSLWVAILLGTGLWATAVSTAVVILWAVAFLGWKYARFLRRFYDAAGGPRVDWFGEVWPMQWRIALSWLSGYFIYSLFTPVLFYYHGPVAAGQMGMTWKIVVAVTSVSAVWAAAYAPRFGILVAGRDYAALDRLFFRVFSRSLGVLFLGAITAWFCIYLLGFLGHPLAGRLLLPLPAGLLLLAHVLMQTTGPLSVYLRAHKREPYLALSVVTAILTALSTWLLGSRFGATGIAAGYLAVVTFYTFPYGIIVWWRCRAKWHSGTSTQALNSVA